MRNLLLISMLLAITFCFAEDGQDSFRGIKFGSNIKKIPDMKFAGIDKDTGAEMYGRIGDKYSVGGYELEGILYLAKNDIFYSYCLIVKSIDNFDKVKAIVEAKYPKETLLDLSLGDWICKDYVITCDTDNESGAIFIKKISLYKKLFIEHAKDKLKRTASDDL